MLVNTLTNVNKWHLIVKCYQYFFFTSTERIINGTINWTGIQTREQNWNRWIAFPCLFDSGDVLLWDVKEQIQA